jgi:DNA end-binding protein Ku
MASPRSFWTGSLRLGLMNIPVSLGKGSNTTREKALTTVCAVHGTPPDRSERCDECGGPPASKQKAVQLGDGTYRKFSENEIIAIESASENEALDVLDVQPVNQIPLHYAIGTYFVRPKDRAATQAFKILFEALERNNLALITKLCTKSGQKLCVIHPVQGVLMLQQIPMWVDLREPGEAELAHEHVEADDKAIDMAVQLLEAVRNPDGFEWEGYSDEGLRLRQEAVDRVLEGHTEPVPEAQPEPVADIMDQLAESISKIKEKA